MMDNQQIFNLVVTVAGFLVVYVFNSITKSVAKMEEELKEIPHLYVAKDDYKDDIREIKEILKQIFEKLDNKADKH